MRNRLNRVCVGLGALLLVVPLIAGRALPDREIRPHLAADNASDLAAKKAKVAAAMASASATYEAASARVQAAAAAYAAATDQLPDARQALAVANGAVISAAVDLSRANANATQAEAAVVTAGRAVSSAEVRVAQTRAAVGTVAARAYEGSGLMALNMLMNPGSPSDVLNRMGLLSQVAADEHRVLADYRAAQAQAQAAYQRADSARRTAEASRAAAVSALAASQTSQANAVTAAKTVADLVVARKAALAVAEQNKAATLAQYEALQRENDRITAELAAQAARDRKSSGSSGSGSSSGSSGKVTGTSGYFIMPVHGWKSSSFGWRFDPFYKRWQLHAGVDIAAGGGTPIRAAASGRVVRAGWAGGYGNYTCIDNGLYTGPGQYHNKGIATCYAHQSAILVHIGQHVTTGQVIGKVGETGAATGYHLHFEVRVDGKPVQPVSWLPACFC